jgi:hypothetical protein
MRVAGDKVITVLALGVFVANTRAVQAAADQTLRWNEAARCLPWPILVP